VGFGAVHFALLHCQLDLGHGFDYLAVRIFERRGRRSSAEAAEKSLMCFFCDFCASFAPSAFKNPFASKITLQMKKSSKVNRAWINDHVNDPYVKQAKKEGYRARAAYKLKEIDETLGLVKPGQLVVDLGSAPGAWSQYLRRKLSPQGAAQGELNGTILAIDILPMEPVEGVQFLQGDFTEPGPLAQLQALLAGRQADVVVSDMAPNLSGIEAADSARISHLVELAVDFSLAHMKPQGALVVKLFHGSGYSQLVKLFKETFKTVKPIKPKASRDKSSETFLVGVGLKAPGSSL
jgi:23S rRNA (uridine2552-2'-O)-methyltransferase